MVQHRPRSINIGVDEDSTVGCIVICERKHTQVARASQKAPARSHPTVPIGMYDTVLMMGGKESTSTCSCKYTVA